MKGSVESISSAEVVVIGGGPGGYVAAIRASQLGMKVTLVEKDKLGGVCLNWGCIPTKALLRSAEVFDLIKRAEEFGIQVGKSAPLLDKMVLRSRAIANKLSNGIDGLMQKNKITVVKGQGSFIDKQTLQILSADGNLSELKFNYAIIATGARPRLFNDKKSINYWTYKDAMVPQKIPESLVIVGSGAIGIEFASFYNAIGTRVTVLESLPQILPNEDHEIAAEARKNFEKEGIQFYTSVNVKEINDKSDNQKEVKFEMNGKVEFLDCENVLVAIGTSPNSEGLNLEKVGIELKNGRIVADLYGSTSNKRIFAIGDINVTGPWLAHKASHEGIIAAEMIAVNSGKYLKEKVHSLNVRNIPACTYSSPQIASVGLTEKKAKELKYDCRIGVFPSYANGKAIAVGEVHGFVKTIFDKKTGELLGAHMIGHEVTEMIQGFVVGKQSELVEEDFINTVFPHPTITEMMHESVLAAMGRGIHL